MGLLDDYSGIGMSPRPKWQHQRAMAKMSIRSSLELEKKGLEILTEATVTDDWDDKAPDLVIFDRTMRPLSIIEITRSYQLHAIMDKCEELMERFPDAEYFVYDYETTILYGYAPEYDKWLSSDEYELWSAYLSQPVKNYFM